MLSIDTKKSPKKFTNVSFFCRLIEGNEYQFRVIAINKAGQSKPSDASKNFLAKPRFLAPKIDRRHLRDVTLSAGSTLKLEAAITGEPAPAVDWRLVTISS